MPKKNKIIVSITGITVVLLALLGITYAYYLTRIEGNTNTNSISVTTAKLELVYSDNSEEIITGTNALVPKLGTETNDAIGTKTFTVTNNGNDSSYVVVIDNVEVTESSDATNTTFESNDFKYILNCVIESANETRNGTKCNEVEYLSSFPINGGVLVGNNIESGDIHKFTYKMWYLDNGRDQSNDMGKTLQARINITDISSVNPYSENTNTLAYHILNNSINKTNGTRLVNTPPTKVAIEASSNDLEGGTEYHIFPNFDSLVYYGTLEELSTCSINECPDAKEYTTCTEDVIGKMIRNTAFVNQGPVTGCVNGYPTIGTTKYENVLSITKDDYGMSYYYRGNVQDNYVNFNNMCWRIVRIEGDGSIKLILEDENEQCNDRIGNDLNNNGEYFVGDWVNDSLLDVGFTVFDENNIFNYNKTQTLLNNWFNSKSDLNVPKFDKNIKSKIKSNTMWCIGDMTNVYSYSEPHELLSLDRNAAILNGESFYYETGKRIMGKGVNPYSTLVCKNNYYSYIENYVGLLSIDEIVFAGLSYLEDNENTYLTNLYQLSGGTYEMLIPSLFSYEENYGNNSDTFLSLGYSGGIYYYSSVTPYPWLVLRPVISLIDGITISGGVGTQEKPYVIE